MTDSNAPIRAHMSQKVQVISLETSLPQARKLMEFHGIRHLPVLDGDNIVGLLSERDLGKLEGFPMVNLDLVSVPDAMVEDPYVVDPDTPLLEVVRQMRSRRYGSAIVADAGRVVGIFTATDALDVLVDMLSE